MDEKNNREAEDTWPSVETAYEFVRPCYDWAQSRLDAIDSRIQTLLAFAASITTVIPVFVTSVMQAPNFKSTWFFLALATFLAIAVVGIIARSCGGLKLVSPQKLYEGWLHYSEWEFKKNAIYWAGQHFESNRSIINTKAILANIMMILFFVQGLFWFLWVV